ncbi:MAG TPA: hypothetical protein VHO67_10850 [Polyangia bacterium]|nr:hypothetical protein [Polyangia bacterium]
MPNAANPIATSRVRRIFLLALAGAVGCAADGDSDGRPLTSSAGAVTAAGTGAKLDLLFMIDNSSSMLPAQQKLLSEMQSFAAALEALPGGLPDLHIAVVSSDMGAPGDSAEPIGCTQSGDGGQFHSEPHNGCASTGLEWGGTFISTSGGSANFTGPLADVLTCIAPLGATGCGFEHQLASVARALGADGKGPPPPSNNGFLRADAELAIILLTNEDDCSAPEDTPLYSLNGFPQSQQNPMGPIANYRCNRYGHLCKDPLSADPNALVMPPQLPPADATGSPPSISLTECVSDDGCSGLLTPVVSFVNGIKALKANPDQIVVGAIVAPPEPYAVKWVPPAPPPPGSAGELWPEVLHSCGALSGNGVNPAGQNADDGSFGDPAVRIAQWVRAFGANGFISSICDSTYAGPMQQLATLIAAHLQPSGAPPATPAPSETGPLATSAACGVHGRPTGHPGGASGCSVAADRQPRWAAVALAGLALVAFRARRRRR